MRTGTVEINGQTVNVTLEGGWVKNDAGQVLTSQELINSVVWS